MSGRGDGGEGVNHRTSLQDITHLAIRREDETKLVGRTHFLAQYSTQCLYDLSSCTCTSRNTISTTYTHTYMMYMYMYYTCTEAHTDLRKQLSSR